MTHFSVLLITPHFPQEDLPLHGEFGAFSCTGDMKTEEDHRATSPTRHRHCQLWALPLLARPWALGKIRGRITQKRTTRVWPELQKAALDCGCVLFEGVGLAPCPAVKAGGKEGRPLPLPGRLAGSPPTPALHASFLSEEDPQGKNTCAKPLPGTQLGLQWAAVTLVSLVPITHCPLYCLLPSCAHQTSRLLQRLPVSLRSPCDHCQNWVSLSSPHSEGRVPCARSHGVTETSSSTISLIPGMYC